MANALSFLRQIEGAAKPDDLYHFARKLVGVDAHIDPAVRTVFTEICGESAASEWADVGIGPYRKRNPEVYNYG